MLNSPNPLGLINHVALVLDASGSMQGKQNDVNKVVDGLVEFLAKRSTELDQETRVTVYLFDDKNTVKVFDKDVLRLPRNLYQVSGGWTALIDATIQSQHDLAKTCQLYGDHAFLTYVITDGEENKSFQRPSTLQALFNNQADNWTVACLVPNLRGKLLAKDYGFPPGNIEVWDTNSVTGVAEVGEKITMSTNTYMENRASGITSSKTLFAQQVTQAQVDASSMVPVDPSKFVIVPVVATGSMEYVIPRKTQLKSRPEGIKHVEIMAMVESTGRRYIAGNAFYELVKSEKFEPHKRVALIHTDTRKVYIGEEAKALIGLTGTSTRIRPMPKDKLTKKPEYEVFIQSQSTNRLLPVGSRILLMN